MLQMARNATDENSGSSVANGTFSMIAIPSSAPRFWMYCDQAAAYGHDSSAAESESERLRRALGVLYPSRMLILFWEKLRYAGH